MKKWLSGGILNFFCSKKRNLKQYFVFFRLSGLFSLFNFGRRWWRLLGYHSLKFREKKIGPKKFTTRSMFSVKLVLFQKYIAPFESYYRLKMEMILWAQCVETQSTISEWFRGSKCSISFLYFQSNRSFTKQQRLQLPNCTLVCIGISVEVSVVDNDVIGRKIYASNHLLSMNG